jgi:hypothetical protein
MLQRYKLPYADLQTRQFHFVDICFALLTSIFPISGDAFVRSYNYDCCLFKHLKIVNRSIMFQSTNRNTKDKINIAI